MKTDHRSRRRALLTSAAAPAIALALMATGAGAQESAKTFAIAPQPLADALLQLSKQADIDIVASTDLTRGRTAPKVAGEMTTADAMSALLAGSGLVAAPSGAGYVITRASDPQSGSAAGGGAEGTVQALVVTAQKREENIQDVPIAMSAFTQEDLTKSQVAGGPDLMTQVPNFTFTKTNFSGYSIQIRGIGTQAISATTDPAVAVAFNNTPFISNRFFEQEFYDLERVEVLRGPQGTLYGRNATAGVVNIISAKPNTHEFQAKLSADVANYNSTRLEGMINLPLVEDKAALRIAGAWTKRDGYVKNILTGKQTDGRNLWSGRVTLGLTPTDSVKANLIYEHFSENDDRLRSGKQLCHKDPGPPGFETTTGDPFAAIFSQGCIPASLYSPDSFQTPNGFSLPYFDPIYSIGAPIILGDPYSSQVQSRNLREIETHIKPDYEASNDTVELQLHFDLPNKLSLTSETGFNRDRTFSFEDYNRFDTQSGVFLPGGRQGNDFALISENGVFCDPQLGCTTRLAAGDLSTAAAKQFSQEFRVASEFEGPLNFSLGANFVRYDTEAKYYVFVNTLTSLVARDAIALYGGQWTPGVTDNAACYNAQYNPGYVWSNASSAGDIDGCHYIDPNNIHSLNDLGRNYFLSKNPYHLLSYAAFGETYFDVAPNVKITAGLRWTDDRKEAPQIPSWLLSGNTYGTPTRKVIHQEWREPTGRLAIDWKPKLSFTDQTLLYASYVRGYKAGGANPPPAIVVFPPVGRVRASHDAIVLDSLTHPETFGPEFVNAYEVGTKNTLWDGRLVLNLNGFYYDYTGYQISQIVDRSAVNLNFDAKIFGSELELDWRPVENLRVGFKGGYEHTELAKGSGAIDLMDRTAGDTNYIVKKPFPTFPSNCIVPVGLAALIPCDGYKLPGIDPVTNLPYVPNPTLRMDVSGHIGPLNLPGYPGFNPASVPNNGEGIVKDLSGNELPNAPKFTATLTADYTIPLPNEWLATLHTDLYYQSEAWWRVFNDPGYDKLKAYSNVNVAAIFTNEDRGWQVMAYVKNVLNKDNITGAFLNSDDTGLTTNVFLNEPRLYGLRITKNWSGGDPLGRWLGDPHTGDDYPLRVEVGGDYGRFGNSHEILSPDIATLFTDPQLPFPLDKQRNIDWGTDGEMRLTYQPQASSWSVSAAIRYGRAQGSTVANHKKKPTGGFLYNGKYYWDAANGLYIQQFQGGIVGLGYDFSDTNVKNEEVHTIADFVVGKDVGLGAWNRLSSSTISAGLRYAHLQSDSHATLHGRPDIAVPPDNVLKYGITTHRFNGALNAGREFEGAGLTGGWDGSVRLFGDSAAAGRVDLDLGVGGSVLWGRQTANVSGQVSGGYLADYVRLGHAPHYVTSYNTPIQQARHKSVTVPGVNGDLGLSYTLGRVRVSSGYRWERYFNIIDGGIQSRKTYDRQNDGAYFKVSVGFGG